jgi:hypothetical protein
LEKVGMSDRTDRDPELDLAEICLDIGDMCERHFEFWSQHADDEHRHNLRVLLNKLASESMLLANDARAGADNILRDYDGSGN